MKYINDSSLNYLISKFNSFFKKNANNTINHGKFVVDNIYSDKIDLKDSNGNRIIEVSNKHLNNGNVVHTKDDWTLKIGQITRVNTPISPFTINKNGDIKITSTYHKNCNIEYNSAQKTVLFNDINVKLDNVSTLYLRETQITNSPSYINYDTVAVRDAQHRYIYGSTTAAYNENKLTIENYNFQKGYANIKMYRNTSKFGNNTTYNTIMFNANDYAFYGENSPTMKLYQDCSPPTGKVGNRVFYVDYVDKVTFDGYNTSNTKMKNDFFICDFRKFRTIGLDSITFNTDKFIVDTYSDDITMRSYKDILMYADSQVHIESGSGSSFTIYCDCDLNIDSNCKISNHLYMNSIYKQIKYKIGNGNSDYTFFNIEANGYTNVKHSKYSMDIPIVNSSGTDISSTMRFLWYSYGNSTVDNFEGLKIGYNLWSDEPEIYMRYSNALIELNTNHQDVYMKLYGDNDDGEVYINCNNQQIYMRENQEGNYLGGIFLQCKNNRKAYYTKTNAATANDEIATKGDISSLQTQIDTLINQLNGLS